jgi:hypothetical protein
MIDQRIHELEAIVEKAEPSIVSMKTEDMSAGDPISGLVELAAEIVEKRPVEVMALCQKAVDANLLSMTERKFTGIEIPTAGFSTLRDSAGGRLSWPQMDARNRALARFCVQFTLWQLLATLRPMPFVIDLVSGAVDDPMTRITLAAAQHLAKKAQVLVLAP